MSGEPEGRDAPPPKQRIPYGAEHRYSGRDFMPAPTKPCHDCGAIPGHLHDAGCDWEECETCGGQRIACSCCVVCRDGGDTWCVCGKCIEIAERGRGSSQAGSAGSPERDLLATAVGSLTHEDVVHLAESWTDRDGCFYGGVPEWRAALLGRLRERFPGAASPSSGEAPDVDRLRRDFERLYQRALTANADWVTGRRESPAAAEELATAACRADDAVHEVFEQALRGASSGEGREPQVSDDELAALRGLADVVNSMMYAAPETRPMWEEELTEAHAVLQKIRRGSAPTGEKP